MNPPSSASPSIDFSLSSAQIPLGQLLGPYEGDLQKVRNLISERIFREEAFGDLLLTTGDLCGWRNWGPP
jgi:hypothetical protein